MEPFTDKPSTLNTETKLKGKYLSQIAGNIEEKSLFLIQELQAEKLPKIKGRTRILDCGIGGGETVYFLKNEYDDPFIDIIALDIIPEYIKRIEGRLGILGVVGNASHPPFGAESLSAINLSSVLHEIISYDLYNGTVSRFSATEKLFFELSLCLTINGLFSYRDIYLPQNHNEKKLIAYSGSFLHFIFIYGDQIVQNTKRIFRTDIPNISIRGDFCEVWGHIHYHRELQRHFITFTDFLCIHTKNISLKDFLKNEDGPNSIEDIFKDGFLQPHLLDEWRRREGFETYIYASVSEIKEILSTISQKNDFRLEVEREIFPERREYTNFIKRYADFVIPDKKQMLLIRKK